MIHISITWGFNGNADSQATAKTYWTRVCIWTRFPSWRLNIKVWEALPESTRETGPLDERVYIWLTGSITPSPCGRANRVGQRQKSLPDASVQVKVPAWGWQEFQVGESMLPPVSTEVEEEDNPMKVTLVVRRNIPETVKAGQGEIWKTIWNIL